MTDELRGMRIAVLATDGIEQVELEPPPRAVEQAGARTELPSLRDGDVQAMNSDLERPGTSGVDRRVGGASAGDHDAPILPGDTCTPDRLRMDDDAVGCVREFSAVRAS